MQGVHTCTDMTLGWSATFALSQTCATLRSATFALSQTCATLELWRFPHMEAQPLPFPKPAQRSKRGGAFPKPSQRSKRAALSIGKRNLCPFPKPLPLPNLRTAGGGAGLGRSSTRAVVGATRVGVLEGFAFASRGRILAKSQKCQKRDIVDSQSTHEGELSPLAGKTGPFLLHEG
jgi:hypothetical protein